MSCCLVERWPSRTRGQCESGPRGGSAAGEVRRALLGERGHALLSVLAREQVAEALDLGAEVTLVLALECQIERGLSGGECDRAAGGERAGGLPDLRHQLVRLVDGADKADSECLFGIDCPAREDQVP